MRLYGILLALLAFSVGCTQEPTGYRDVRFRVYKPWFFESKKCELSGVAADDSKLYVLGGHTEKKASGAAFVTALEPESMKTLWSIRVREDYNPGLSFNSRHLFYSTQVGRDYKLRALNKETGAEEWTLEHGLVVRHADDNRLLVRTNKPRDDDNVSDIEVKLFQAGDGSLIQNWQRNFALGYSGRNLYQGKILAFDPMDKKLVLLALADGKVEIISALDIESARYLLVDGDLALILSEPSKSRLLAMDLKAKSKIWEKPMQIQSNLAVENGVAWFIQAGAKLTALSLDSGKTEWVRDLEPDSGFGNVVVKNGNLFVLHHGQVSRFDLKGAPVSVWRLPGVPREFAKSGPVQTAKGFAFSDEACYVHHLIF